EIHAGYLAIFHDETAIDDDAVDVAAGAADQHGLDGIDDLADIGVFQVPDHDVGAATGRQSPEIGAAESVRTTQRRRIEIIFRPAGRRAVPGEPAQDQADLHIEQHIGR